MVYRNSNPKNYQETLNRALDEATAKLLEAPGFAGRTLLHMLALRGRPSGFALGPRPSGPVDVQLVVRDRKPGIVVGDFKVE